MIGGFSATIDGRVNVARGGVVQCNFGDYRILSMADTPEIDVRIVESGAKLGGAGEGAIAPEPPALCNAIHTACGVRTRTLPLTASGWKLDRAMRTACPPRA